MMTTTDGTLATKAVERALDERHREGSEDAERIVAAMRRRVDSPPS